jgi:hypothetical protein
MKLTNEELIRRSKYLNGCHWINLNLRRDGTDVDMEGDWLKEILKELMDFRGLHYPPSNFKPSITTSTDETSPDPPAGRGVR